MFHSAGPFELCLAFVLALAPLGAPAKQPPASAPRAPAVRRYLSLDEALSLAFPGARIERGTEFLTKEQKKAAEKLADEKLSTAIVHPYVAHDAEGKVLGTAWVDVHRVRTLRETLFVVVGPDQKVVRVELLAFGEPEDYIPRASWYGQYVGRRLDDELRLKRGIRGVTGATLTARATTSAVRRVLAVHQVLNGAPEPTPEPGPGGAAPGTAP